MTVPAQRGSPMTAIQKYFYHFSISCVLERAVTCSLLSLPCQSDVESSQSPWKAAALTVQGVPFLQ